MHSHTAGCCAYTSAASIRTNSAICRRAVSASTCDWNVCSRHRRSPGCAVRATSRNRSCGYSADSRKGTSMLGNDLVDLGDADSCAAALHARFDGRVFDPVEREWIAASPHGERVRWLIWAAKESAYKAARK